nr:MAG TPA: hypothetical protein [Herelleviridae sp.]
MAGICLYNSAILHHLAIFPHTGEKLSRLGTVHNLVARQRVHLHNVWVARIEERDDSAGSITTILDSTAEGLEVKHVIGSHVQSAHATRSAHAARSHSTPCASTDIQHLPSHRSQRSVLNVATEELRHGTQRLCAVGRVERVAIGSLNLNHLERTATLRKRNRLVADARSRSLSL